jgi:hypothetical protein
MTGATDQPGLPPGTRVQLRDGAKLTGTVMPYARECSQGLLGLFPVRLDNCIWRICHASNVIVNTTEASPSASEQCPRRPRTTTTPSDQERG